MNITTYYVYDIADQYIGEVVAANLAEAGYLAGRVYGQIAASVSAFDYENED